MKAEEIISRHKGWPIHDVIVMLISNHITVGHSEHGGMVKAADFSKVATDILLLLESERVRSSNTPQLQRTKP